MSDPRPCLTVKCDHGIARTLDLQWMDSIALRGVAQELLLACPRCRYEARGFLFDPELQEQGA